MSEVLKLVTFEGGDKMGHKRKSSFDNIANNIEVKTGHDTIISESKLGNIDDQFTKGKKLMRW